MSEYLPCGRFKWLKHVDKFDVMPINDKSSIGYFLEDDLEYPDELHELHTDYPLAPEKLAVSSDILSNYCKKNADKPTYITHKTFGKVYAAIHEIKPALILIKPIYVGFTVLDLSKWKMHDFYYNFIKKNFNTKLLFTDTDSLTYEIKSENL